MTSPSADIAVWSMDYQPYHRPRTAIERQAARQKEAALFEKRGAFRFLDLSAELRTTIYKYVLTCIMHPIECRSEPSDRPLKQEDKISFVGMSYEYTVGLLFTCKRVYQEAVPIALSQNIIQFCSTKLALMIMQRYGMDKQGRRYRIKIDQSLHMPHDSISVTEPSTSSPLLLQIINFCKENPHIQVELNIHDIQPGDMPYVRQKKQPDSTKWYSFMLAHQPEVPPSLDIVFYLEEWDWEDHSERKWYHRLEPKLRVWGGAAVHWPWPERNDHEDKWDGVVGRFHRREWLAEDYPRRSED